MAVSQEQKALRVLSLFSGCGGMDLGFEGGFEVLKKSINEDIHPDWLACQQETCKWIRLPKTRFETIFANDIFPAAKVAWESYFAKDGKQDTFHLESIVDLVKRQRNGEKIFPKADIVTGGFPCQDFSIAGKRNGFRSHKGHHGTLLKTQDDPSEENRGRLYMWMRHVIEIVRPKVFVAENVKGLISLPDVKEIIEDDFRDIGSGYIVVNAKVLYAPRFGIPQNRERVIFIGFRKDTLNKTVLKELSAKQISEIYDPYPQPTHDMYSHSLFQELPPFVTAKDYLEDLDEPEDSVDPSHQAYSKARWYGKHCQGQTEVDLDGIAPTIRSEHHGNIEFRRLSVEHGGKHTCELKKGLPERRLSVRECARLQTFPDNFEFVKQGTAKISASEGYKLVGNAVPPLLGFHIAWRLQELWPRIFK
jgi:DNA (cytosine-5)-methyltransferase 1